MLKVLEEMGKGLKTSSAIGEILMEDESDTADISLNSLSNIWMTKHPTQIWF